MKQVFLIEIKFNLFKKHQMICHNDSVKNLIHILTSFFFYAPSSVIQYFERTIKLEIKHEILRNDY